LAFVGLGLIWILSGGGVTNASNVQIGGHYRWPMIGLILGLALDLLQFVYLSQAWWLFACGKEWAQAIADNPNFTKNRRIKVWVRMVDAPDGAAPSWLNTPAEYCFGAKIAVVTGSYIWLLVAPAQQLL